MSKLPNGWARASLSEVTRPRNEKVTPTLAQKDQPFIGMDNIEAHTAKLLSTQTASNLKSSVSVFRKNDILYGRLRPYLNKVYKASFDGVASAEFIVLPPNSYLKQDFLAHVLRQPQFVELATQRSTGDRPRVKFDNIEDFEFYLPPLNEQGRIVAKLDSLRTRTSRVRHELDLIPKLIERYKQAILAKAFSGELTADWRRLNATENSPLADLAAFDLSDEERGEWPARVLPTGWKWLRFEEFFSDETSGTKKLPQKAYLIEGQYPVIDQGEEVIGGYTTDSSVLSPAEPPIILFGDHTRCVKYIDFPFVQGADGTKVLKPRATVCARYACFAMQAVTLPNKGYSRHMKFLRASLFPCCSIDEQQEIVTRIEQTFRFLDKIQKEHDLACRLLPKLDQAILAKAFRGELVPQDPNDEPASVLLERIRAKRAEERPKKVQNRKQK